MQQWPIFLGYDKCTDDQVAILIQEKDTLRDSALNALRRRDPRMIRATQTHPSILRIVDVFETTNTVHTVTELVTGGTLREVVLAHSALSALADGSSAGAGHSRAGCRDAGTNGVGVECLSTQLAKQVVSDVLSALAHLHARRIVHGHLDDDMILCRHTRLPSPVKLVVFGVATALPSSTFSPFPDSGSGNVSGSRGVGGSGSRGGGGVDGGGGEPSERRMQLAPEVVCFRQRDSASDVFAAGVLAFRLLTGAPPFDGHNISDYLADVSNAKYSAAWEHVGGARPLLERMLKDDGEKRPSVEVCLRHTWFAGCTGREHDRRGRRWTHDPSEMDRRRSDPKSVITEFDSGDSADGADVEESARGGASAGARGKEVLVQVMSVLEGGADSLGRRASWNGGAV